MTSQLTQSEPTPIPPSFYTPASPEDPPLLPFYWIDAMESHIPGEVHIFGRIYDQSTNAFSSSYLFLKGIPQRIYLRPRPEVLESDPDTLHPVLTEFTDLAKELKIEKGTFDSKVVQKKSVLNPEGLPKKSSYLEITYPPYNKKLTHTCTGKTFDKVLGIDETSLEYLLTEKTLKGPCWLQIHSPHYPSFPQSWCKFNIGCSIYQLSVLSASSNNLPIPSIVVTVMNVKSSILSGTAQERIRMIHLLTHKNFTTTGGQYSNPDAEECFHIAKPTPQSFFPLPSKIANFIECKNEIDLLQQFLDKFSALNPDVIMGYDCKFSFNNLIDRIQSILPKQQVSKICKLKKSSFQKPHDWYWGPMYPYVFFRPVCDVQTAVTNINSKIRALDLESVSVEILKIEKRPLQVFSSHRIDDEYSTLESIHRYTEAVRSESHMILRILKSMNIIPLAFEITSLVGHVLSRTLVFPINERSEFLLLHAFHKAGYLVPNKLKPYEHVKFTGGLILDAACGIHESVCILMDFTSLYPSIIRECNLCLTTTPANSWRTDEIFLKSRTSEEGVLPRVVSTLVEARAAAKASLKADIPDKMKTKYQCKQLALKLVANSLYGSLGSRNFEFYCPSLAATITHHGRVILEKAKESVESIGLTVIYGDTDSLMINTNQNEDTNCREIIAKIKEVVEQPYRYIKLEMDVLFRSVLIAHRRCYTAMAIDKSNLKLVMKGYQYGKVEHCEMVRTSFDYILEKIFADEPMQVRIDSIIQYLKKLSKSLRTAPPAVLAARLATTKRFPKEIDRLSLKAPHVNLAVRLNRLCPNKHRFVKGDRIQYVVVLDGTDEPPNKRSQLLSSSGCKQRIDVDYYVSSELLPVISNFCKPIPELSIHVLAECLGVSLDKYSHLISEESDASNFYKRRTKVPVEGFTFTCRVCSADNLVKGFCRETEAVPVLGACAKGGCDGKPWTFVGGIEEELVEALNGIGSRHMEAKRGICLNRKWKCRWVGYDLQRLPDGCPVCKCRHVIWETSQQILYVRLLSLRKWFDVGGQPKGVRDTLSEGVVDAYGRLRRVVERKIEEMACNFMEVGSVS